MQRVWKTLTVDPVLRGQPADGYILGKMTAIPETIKAGRPKLFLNLIQS